jgi:hypothetical protein
MKKILFITFLMFTTLLFAQQNGSSKKVEPIVTISSVTATPNPFSFSTKINFQSSKEQTITFTIKNLLGKNVYSESMNIKIGANTINFEKNNLSKGMYIYSLQTEFEVVSKRLVIQ